MIWGDSPLFPWCSLFVIFFSLYRILLILLEVSEYRFQIWFIFDENKIILLYVNSRHVIIGYETERCQVIGLKDKTEFGTCNGMWLCFSLHICTSVSIVEKREEYFRRRQYGARGPLFLRNGEIRGHSPN
jgi:hypothetical protein